jgi:2'-5' RNA ligase
MDGNNFSLWLMPCGDVYHRLQELIFRLSQEWSSPLFEPHVTLLGRLEGTEAGLQSETSIIASQLKPMTIQLGTLGFLEEYYRCLFIRVVCSRKLTIAHQSAAEAFCVQKESKFMPHISLVYANLDSTTKLKIIRGIGGSFHERFHVASVHLYSTTGPPQNWYRIGEYPLGKANSAE